MENKKSLTNMDSKELVRLILKFILLIPYVPTEEEFRLRVQILSYLNPLGDEKYFVLNQPCIDELKTRGDLKI